MSKNIVEELPARKHAPVAAPVAKKEGGKPSGEKSSAEKSSGGKPAVKKGGTSEEASEKRIRQAVYDIRYRARKDDIELSVACAQYLSNSNLSAKEVAAVKEKLGLNKSSSVKEQFTKGADDWATDGLANALYKVFVEQEDPEFELAYTNQLDESEDTKYKVRVTDKNGRTYVRFATRTKITELRANPNIKSVEMTEHGDVVGSERKRGKQTAKAKRGLDPVGKEDADIDNDGKPNDKNDKYIRNRRDAIKNSIRNRAEQKIKEAYGATGSTSVEAPTGSKKVKEDANIDNHASGAVKVNPTDKQKDPSVAKARGVFAHLQLLGTNLSESEKKLLKIVSKKKEEEEKKEVASVMTKDKVDDPCAPEEGEEKKDMRGTYAKLNIIRNKFRAAGQRTPFVTLDDIGEEKKKGLDGKECWDGYKLSGTKKKGGKTVDNCVKVKEEKVEEGAYETVKTVLDKGSKFIKTNPVGKVLGKIVEPVKGNKGKNYPTKATQKEKGLRTGN